jgi:hypothetical protein
MLNQVKDGSDEEIDRLRAQLASLGQKRPRPSETTKNQSAPPMTENSEVRSALGGPSNNRKDPLKERLD